VKKKKEPIAKKSFELERLKEAGLLTFKLCLYLNELDIEPIWDSVEFLKIVPAQERASGKGYAQLIVPKRVCQKRQTMKDCLLSNRQLSKLLPFFRYSHTEQGSRLEGRLYSVWYVKKPLLELIQLPLPLMIQNTQLTLEL
jgi:hypothetical protein